MTPTVAPGIPQQVAVTSGNRSLTINWPPSPAAASYTVQRSTNSSGPYSPLPGAIGLLDQSFKDTSLTNEQTYYYRVQAANAFGQSPPSTVVAGTPGIRVQRAACGSAHTVAVLSDGSLWAWGSNRTGQLGIGTSLTFSAEAVEVALTEVVELAAGNDFTLALRSDGTVWSWGANYGGQLGTGTMTPSPIPVQALTPPGIVKLAARNTIALALTDAGEVWGWGLNPDLMGLPITGTPVMTPTKLPGLSNIVSIAAGYAFTLAARSDGRVLACGSNSGGQMGDGTTNPRSFFDEVKNLSGIIEVAGGVHHGVGLASDGAVWAWGGAFSPTQNNGTGLLGGSLLPRVLSGISSVKQLRAGISFTVMLRSDGTVWSCGANSLGQLGNPVPVDSLPPVQATSVTGIESLAVGDNHVLAIQSGGLLWGWGENTFGALGNGRCGVQPVPAPAASLTDVVDVIQTGTFGLACRSDHSLWSWGYGLEGALGNGAKTDITGYRVKVLSSAGPTNPVALGGSGSRAFVLNSDGKVYSWGAHGQAALGNGTGVVTPVTVPTVISSITGAAGVGANGGGAFAIKAGGTVVGWGKNDAGEVGVGNFTSPIGTPTQLLNLTSIIAVTGGLDSSMALTSGGTVWTWGIGNDGELGNGIGSPRNSPAVVPGLSGVTAIASGWGFELALKSDGTVWGWGRNLFGVLGPALGNGILPQQIQGLDSITAIAAGDHHGVALKSDGSVWCWGGNIFGELGNGTLKSGSTPTPAPVAGLPAPVKITVGGRSNLALLSSGEVWGWGANGFGQMANGAVGWEPLPIIITR